MTIFKELSINSDIREKEVRLISESGEQLGVMSTAAAQRLADVKDRDLVMISPTANPPVCKIMDYNKYRFDQIKKEKEDKKNRSVVELKEMRLSAVIDIGDLKTKAKKVREFLTDGNKVKVSIMMRGRQQAHPEISMGIMDSFFEEVKDLGIIEKRPNQEGRIINMVLAPIKK